MASRKFYAVKEGRTPGIYFNWVDCEAQVKGYQGAKYRSFDSVEAAYHYIESDGVELAEEHDAHDIPEGVPEGPYAFVDGSFNAENGVYGYGGFLDVNGRRYPLMGSGSDAEMASMRNVAGEIEGSMAAVRKAEELNLRCITILYDYKGIEEWARGGWKATKSGTEAYRDFMADGNRRVEIDFVKVKGHTGIEGNEMADVMAKSAVGIKLTKSQKKLLDEALAAGSRDGVDVPCGDSPADGKEMVV